MSKTFAEVVRTQNERIADYAKDMVKVAPRATGTRGRVFKRDVDSTLDELSPLQFQWCLNMMNDVDDPELVLELQKARSLHHATYCAYYNES
jgi:hypothetical protein